MAEAVIEIARDADAVYKCLCDVRSVVQWVRGVASVEVMETDAQGRPTVVRFISMPARASVSYALHYAYNDEQRQVEWRPHDHGERTLEGRAQVVPLGPQRCRLHYRLDVRNAASIPMWARSSLKEDVPQTAVSSFRRWVERVIPADHGPPVVADDEA